MDDITDQVNVNTGTVLDTVQGMINGFLSILPNLIIGIVVLILFYFIAQLIRAAIQRTTEKRTAANVGLVFGRLAFGLTLLLGFLVAATIVLPNLKPADIIGSLGIGGVAIGFAFRDILQNLLAGILILLREPFRIGDQIVSGDFEGTVEDIEMRATILKTYDGRRVVIPNGDIYTSAVVVNTAHDKRRSQYDIGIGYADDIGNAKEIILGSLSSVEGVLADPAPEVLTVDLAGSTVNLRARWWTAPQRSDVVHVADNVITSIKQALDKAAIDMPYETQVVLWHDQTEETDGDRTRQREGWPAGDEPPKARWQPSDATDKSPGV